MNHPPQTNRPTGEIRLHNVIFPLWLLLLFPIGWVAVLPLNFVIDSLVVLLTLGWLNRRSGSGSSALPVWALYRGCILRVWGIGFLSDLIAALPLLATQLLPIQARWWYDYITAPVAYNPLDNWFALGYVLVCVAVGGISIYLLNLRFSLRRLALGRDQARKLALALAVFTAPYLFVLPTQLLYSGPEDLQLFTNHLVGSDKRELLVQQGELQAVVNYQGTLNPQLLLTATDTARPAQQLPQELTQQQPFQVTFRSQEGDPTPVQMTFWASPAVPDGYFTAEGRPYLVTSLTGPQLALHLQQALGTAPNRQFTLLSGQPLEETSPSPEALFLCQGEWCYYCQHDLYSPEATLQFDDPYGSGPLTAGEALDQGLVTIQELAGSGLLGITAVREGTLP